MADYTVTAASVLASSTATKRDGVAGATITAGQALYLDSSDQTLKLADSNSGTAAARTVVGISLNGGATGQPIKYCTADSGFAPGFSIPAGSVVILSDTPGGLRPVADAVSGDFVTVIGLGIGSNTMALGFIASTIAVP
jgi:hypothetical protein